MYHTHSKKKKDKRKEKILVKDDTETAREAFQKKKKKQRKEKKGALTFCSLCYWKWTARKVCFLHSNYIFFLLRN